MLGPQASDASSSWGAVRTSEWVASASSMLLAVGALTYALVVPYMTSFYALFFVNLDSTGISPSSLLTTGSAPVVMATVVGSYYGGYLLRATTGHISLHLARSIRIFMVSAIPATAFLQLSGAVQPLRSVAWLLLCVWLVGAGWLSGGLLRSLPPRRLGALFLLFLIGVGLVLQPIGQRMGKDDALKLWFTPANAIPRTSLWRRLAGMPEPFPAQQVVSAPPGAPLRGDFIRIIARTNGHVVAFDLTNCATYLFPDEGLVLRNLIGPSVTACTELPEGGD